jgi:hypothetical protein
MPASLRFGLPLAAVTALACLWFHSDSSASPKGAPMIGHMVYFTLKDNSAAAKQKMVDACKKYLSRHEGTVSFSAGTRAEEFKREANDRDWDVALVLLFKDKAAHDQYQVHPQHKQFIEENKDNWSKVRVFDATME